MLFPARRLRSCRRHPSEFHRQALVSYAIIRELSTRVRGSKRIHLPASKIATYIARSTGTDLLPDSMQGFFLTI